MERLVAIKWAVLVRRQDENGQGKFRLDYQCMNDGRLMAIFFLFISKSFIVCLFIYLFLEISLFLKTIFLLLMLSNWNNFSKTIFKVNGISLCNFQSFDKTILWFWVSDSNHSILGVSFCSFLFLCSVLTYGHFKRNSD